MTRLTWLDDSTPLPDPAHALPEGLLAAGGELTLDRLNEAYRKGVFPWYREGDPVLWWSPDPRMVLDCSDFRISHSLRKTLRRLGREPMGGSAGHLHVTLNTAFPDVIRHCADRRRNQEGTWISPEIIEAYSAWHRAGQAHSIETWEGSRLVGGLYGVCLGRFFFGESMFTLVPDASKIAFAHLVDLMQRHDIHHIDCQQETSHLRSLGARPIARDAFLALLSTALKHEPPRWDAGPLPTPLALLAPRSADSR